MHSGNLLEKLPSLLTEELFETLSESRHVKIERIVSQGHASPPDFWYDQPRAEWVAVIAGEAVVQFEGDESHRLRPGDWLEIPAGKRHRVEWATPDELTVWLAVHFEA